MDVSKLAKNGLPKKLGKYVAGLNEGMHHGHARMGAIETLRESEHGGHKILIRTTYQIEVDGRRIRVPLAVDSKGQVHCHSLPNYQLPSAVDMVKTLIDTFPEEFDRKRRPAKRPVKHGGHSTMAHKKGRK